MELCALHPRHNEKGQGRRFRAALEVACAAGGAVALRGGRGGGEPGGDLTEEGGFFFLILLFAAAGEVGAEDGERAGRELLHIAMYRRGRGGGPPAFAEFYDSSAVPAK